MKYDLKYRNNIVLKKNIETRECKEIYDNINYVICRIWFVLIYL